MMRKKNDKMFELPQIAVGAVVFNSAGDILLVKRKNEPSKNMWTIPGGRIQAGETLKQAVEREIFEETALKIKAGEITYTFELIEKKDDGEIKFHYIIIDFDADYISGEPQADDDALETGWISENVYIGLNVNNSTKKLLKEKYNFG